MRPAFSKCHPNTGDDDQRPEIIVRLNDLLVQGSVHFRIIADHRHRRCWRQRKSGCRGHRVLIKYFQVIASHSRDDGVTTGVGVDDTESKSFRVLLWRGSRGCRDAAIPCSAKYPSQDLNTIFGVGHKLVGSIGKGCRFPHWAVIETNFRLPFRQGILLEKLANCCDDITMFAVFLV